MIILPPDTMSEADMKLLRENNICVVVAKDPAKVKFVDPIPAASERTQIENAAIEFSRKILRGDIFSGNRGDFAKLYVDCLVKGTPLSSGPTIEERELAYFTEAKLSAIRDLAREEAKAERAAAKTAKPKT